eukprot:scaffold9.g3017.t1
MADAIVLKNRSGVEVHVLTLGAVIQRLLLPGEDGSKVDIVLGFDDEYPYRDGTSPYFGAVVGRRVAVANRIANATFTLDGKAYKLAANNGPNCLHGGKVGFDKVRWKAKRLALPGSGSDAVSVTYTLADNNTLTAEMEATADAPTPVNLAQHSYFNLAEVDGTPFDFRTPHAIGERIKEVPGKAPGGYDHNFVLFGLGPDAKGKTRHGMASAEPRLAATLVDPASGRGLRVLTTAPGVQLYSGNFLPQGSGLRGKGSAEYRQYGGMCLETQGFPDAINQPAFPSVVLRPGEAYRHVLAYQFFKADRPQGGA